MKYKNVCSLLAIAAISILPNVASAVTLDCAPFKPEKAIQSEVENSFGASVGGWIRNLGTISVGDDYKSFSQDQRFKDPDEVNLRQSFVYLFCATLDKSSLSEVEKLGHYRDLWILMHPPTSSGGMIDNNLIIDNKAGGIKAQDNESITNNKIMGNGGLGIEVTPRVPTTQPAPK